jgi:Cu-processing system ATP-binding protein
MKLELERLSKRFGTRTVLREITLAVRPGAVTAIVGPNGSGKTTLIKLMLGLARPDHGSVRIDGRPVDTDGAYRRSLGYMPQNARFPDHLRVRDLFDMVVALRDRAPRSLELIEAFRLEADMDKPLGTLSGGTRQKVSAAIAFMFNPRLLILDEPTAGLDPVASRILKEKIRDARRSGCTIIITSHILSELQELADDIAYLCDGSFEHAGPVAHLLRSTGTSSLENAIATLMGETPMAARVTTTGQLLALVSAHHA